MSTATPNPGDARPLAGPFVARPPRGGRLRQTGARSVPAVPGALALVVISTFLPEELSFYILGLRLTVTRLILLLLTPFLLARLGQKISTGRYRFVASDLFVLLAGFWMIYAPANIDGAAAAFNHAGPIALEFCIGYLATRALLSAHGQALSFAGLLCRVIAVVGLLALLDPLTNRYLIHDLTGQLTGFPKKFLYWSDAYRLGLLRAFGPVEHPILLAFVCGIGILFAASVPIRSRRFAIVGSSFGAIFAFSSAPLQALLMGVGLLIYNRMLRGVRFRWLVLVGAGAIAVAAAFLISNSPIGFIISHLTYDPSSGYYRFWTWSKVMEAVGLSPWYGLGFGPYPEYLDINHSIDSLWLVTAELFGVPGCVLIALSIIGAASLRVEGPGVRLTATETQLGTTAGIVLFLIIFLAFTVHLWGSTWILTGLLIGLRAHLGELGHLKRPPPRHTGPPPTVDNAPLKRRSSLPR